MATATKAAAAETKKVQMNAFQRNVLKARDVGVPLVAVRTADPAATSLTVSDLVRDEHDNTSAVVQWDSCRGFQAINKQGEAAAKFMGGESITNPVEALMKAAPLEKGVPKYGALLFHNAQDYYGQAEFRQAMWNLRDPFKKDWRTVFLMQPSGGVPSNLEHDVLVIDEPLPSPEELARVVREQYESAGLTDGRGRPLVPTDEVVQKAVDAIAGLSAFAAEQAVALSLMPDGVSLDRLRDRHRQMIGNTKGLSVWRATDGNTGFDSLGGLANFKAFGARFLRGKYRPGAVLWIDEVEKALAGIRGDLTGISQDYLATLLGFMQDNMLPGILLMGHPGTGKSALAKAMAGEAEIPCIRMDLGAMHGSLVGESQHAIRHALKVASAISQDRLVVVATCNSVAVLPPEFVNRFKWRFFVDLPDGEEKKVIWRIQRARYGIDEKDTQPPDVDWNGREIEQCCNTADVMEYSLREAAETVVPIAESSAEEMAFRRAQAHGRYLSASRPGVFKEEKVVSSVTVGGRATRIRNDEGELTPPTWVTPGSKRTDN